MGAKGAQAPSDFLQGALASAEFVTIHNIHVNPIPL